jgi:hypothetical protein
MGQGRPIRPARLRAYAIAEVVNSLAPTLCPVLPAQRTQVGHHPMSELCQTQTWQMQAAQTKGRPKAASNLSRCSNRLADEDDARF